ncbi:DUF5590 domain-containing protein [Brevibacillus humidisoli]|uniref:cell wall elongation regulator TseB-like domain-containing protein n=1 Tax=Brevibacillus humidisoli TaxID=2895522 RepID=UPI001E467B33|nr:DUF5590 domain-containing protein [Brevibacillus humidisoli]UFJ42738.1 DUF5590 domain-containing protein [Brevibacillus humidisoli]
MVVRIVGLLIGIAFIGASAVYHLASSVVAQQNNFDEQARQWAFERTTITQIDEISEYRGKSSYAVVIGKNKVGTPVIAWMTKDDVVFDVLHGTVPKKNVQEAVMKSHPNAVIKHIVPGIDGEKRFWEVLYIDEEKRYNYVYYDFHTGELLRAYRLNKIDSP